MAQSACPEHRVDRLAESCPRNSDLRSVGNLMQQRKQWMGPEHASTGVALGSNAAANVPVTVASTPVRYPARLSVGTPFVSHLPCWCRHVSRGWKTAAATCEDIGTDSCTAAGSSTRSSAGVHQRSRRRRAHRSAARDGRSGRYRLVSSPRTTRTAQRLRSWGSVSETGWLDGTA